MPAKFEKLMSGDDGGLALLPVLAENNYDFLEITDASGEGKIIYANKSFKKLTGHDPFEIIGKVRPVYLFSDATQVLIAEMRSRGVKRLICVTGFGAGNSRASISFLQRFPFQIVSGRAYEDKSLQQNLIKQSDLDWTIARPGVLTSGPGSGRSKMLAKASLWCNWIISRVDVAQFFVRQNGNGAYIRKTPAPIN